MRARVMPLAHPSVGEVMNAPIRVLVRRLVHLVPRSQSHSVLSSMAITTGELS